MREPFRSEFIQHLKAGAGEQDIHDAEPKSGFAKADTPAEYFDRELGRVAVHQRGLCPLLERHVGKVDAILDVGCSTGGTTVALGLSSCLGARTIIGIDPNPLSIAAAPVRARAHDVDDRVQFRQVAPGPLPFGDASFDLVVSVSVLEFITRQAARQVFADELQRVTRPGGFIFISTPSPLRLREMHTRRLLGDFRRIDGLPWSTPPWHLRKMFAGCDEIPLGRDLAEKVVGRFGGTKLPPLPPPLFAWLPRVTRWQKVLFRKPARA